VPVHWPSQRSTTLAVAGTDTPLSLPPDAANISVRFADSAGAQFRRVLDDLIDYPYGCVEQTASRLIPYSIAVQSLGAGEERLAPRLVQQLHTQRFRLAQFAGPKAVFGWWSAPDKNGDALLTTYAYYADWHASRTLALGMPPTHWNRLLEVYRTEGSKYPHWHRALMLFWMQEIGLPVRPMVAALADELAAKAPATGAANASKLDSVVLGAESDADTDAHTRMLASHLLLQAKAPVPAGLNASLNASADALRASGTPLGQALLLLAKRSPATDAPKVLEAVRADMPTVDRALALVWVHRALGGTPRAAENRAALPAPWQPVASATGARLYRLPAGTPRPELLQVSGAAAGTQAVVSFESREPEKSALPVSIERRLWRLKRVDTAAAPAKAEPRKPGQPEKPVAEPVAAASEFALERVASDAVLRTDEVYLDEIVLRTKDGAKLRYGIVEAALPPGASADRSTWGISLRKQGANDAEALERARFETTPTGYAVPVEELSGEFVVRHLVRVAQPGRFALPPVRYYRMYQPEQKAFEDKPRARIEIR
jgi:uncharacterized protein YfaS (alpha-2-macroglobulin family)